uniref:Uncharacterized protein n=1 Tax=Anguilla anguilla TaxID=7936 RepID=A0A0E9TFE1_ANGAN
MPCFALNIYEIQRYSLRRAYGQANVNKHRG